MCGPHLLLGLELFAPIEVFASAPKRSLAPSAPSSQLGQNQLPPSVSVPSILVLEDEAGISRFVCASLSAAGMASRAAGRAAEAERELAAAPADVLIVDLGLPDGRRHQPSLPGVATRLDSRGCPR